MAGYTVTYYDWQHGILPYRGDARAIIPPLVEGQSRALLYFVAEQISPERFATTMNAGERIPWLQMKGLREICQASYLVPGARIRVLRTEQPDYSLFYNTAEEQTCQALFFQRKAISVLTSRKLLSTVK